jgi:hypothetical protein
MNVDDLNHGEHGEKSMGERGLSDFTAISRVPRGSRFPFVRNAPEG